MRSTLIAALLATIPLASAGRAMAGDDPNTLSEAEQAGGWRLLFDGDSTDHWRGFKREGFPDRGWVIEDGCLKVVPGGGGGDIITVEQYSDFELELEWRVARGANSGIMYRVTEDAETTWQTGPEYQILDDDTHRVAPDATNSSGGLYALYSPRGKTLNPAGEYNRARIVVRNGLLEHWLNGEKVIECELGGDDWNSRVAASKFAAYSGFGRRPKGHIALQDHGNEVWFRNIRIRDLSDEVHLFNGRDLSGWTFHLRDGGRMEDTWSVDDDGVLICKGQPIGYIRTEGDHTNFVLRLQWRFSPVTRQAGNSGVLVRMIGEDTVWPRSIEAQLHSGNAGDFWNIGDYPMKTDPERTRGRNTQKTHFNENPVGEWNQYEIIVNGETVILIVNGEVLNKAWDCLETPGKICLQSEGAEIHFRDIRLLPLE